MRSAITALVGGLLLAAAPIEPDFGRAPAPVAAPVITVQVIVIDGDTIEVAGERIRLLKIDTPELTKPRCQQEYDLAIKARARLVELLDNKQLTVVPEGKDPYGRTLAYVYANDDDVGDTLLKEGLALPYQPGPKAKAKRLATWCANR